MDYLAHYQNRLTKRNEKAFRAENQVNNPTLPQRSEIGQLLLTQSLLARYEIYSSLFKGAGHRFLGWK